MSVVLLILKIIGIVLAAVLGIFLLLLLAALFHPVGYLVTGQFEEKLHLRVKLHWLLHLVRLTHRIDGEEQFARLWILCVPLRLYPASEKKPRRKRTGRKKNTKRHMRRIHFRFFRIYKLYVRSCQSSYGRLADMWGICGRLLPMKQIRLR